MSTIRINQKAEATVLVKNEKTLATRWFFERRGVHTGWHRHEYDYLIVPLFDGFLEIEEGGKFSQAELKTGIPYFRRAGVEHDVINANDFPCAFIEIEFLNPAE